LFFGCDSEQVISVKQTPTYILHQNISATVFWVGEEADETNGYIANDASAWDEAWKEHYGGYDDPYNRDGYFPAAFIPKQNPFYVALPFNDLNSDGIQKENLQELLPWYNPEFPKTRSLCKNQWVKITNLANNKTVYAQWEDVGPFESDDAQYVFGKSQPKNTINEHAGIDLSPATRDFLQAADIQKVSWEFVPREDVPNGVWKQIKTEYWYTPKQNATFQWQLTGDLNTSYTTTIYDIDLFSTSKETIEQLHNEGKKVICYFSAGTIESYREDADLFPKEAIGNPLEDWEDENWLDITNAQVQEIMKNRIALAQEKGCDGVEADNVDVYTQESGFNLTQEDQKNYNIFLASQAHLHNLAIGLKNCFFLAATLEPYFDFALSEQCFAYNACAYLEPFTQAYKPIFNVEYDQKYQDDEEEFRALCQKSAEENIYTLVLPRDLDGSFRKSCD